MSKKLSLIFYNTSLVCLFLAFPLAYTNLLHDTFGVYLFEVGIVYFFTIYVTLFTLFRDFYEIKFTEFDLVLCIFTLSVALANLTNVSSSLDSIKTTCLLFSMFLLRRTFFDKLLVKNFIYSLALLWIINLVGIINPYPNYSLDGIMGNRNWSSGLTVSTMPLAIFTIYTCSKKLITRLALSSIVLVLSAFVVLKKLLPSKSLSTVCDGSFCNISIHKI